MFREELGWDDITSSEATLGFKIHRRTHKSGEIFFGQRLQNLFINILLKIKKLFQIQNSGYLRLLGMLFIKSATTNMIIAPRPVGKIT